MYPLWSQSKPLILPLEISRVSPPPCPQPGAGSLALDASAHPPRETAERAAVGQPGAGEVRWERWGQRRGWRRGQEPLGGAGRLSPGKAAGGHLPAQVFFWNPQPWCFSLDPAPSMPNPNPHPALREPCSHLAALWGEAPRRESTSFHLKPQTHPLESV